METLHPGLYFQEIAGVKPVEGNSTSVAGFVGIATKGKINEAVLVTSWPQFVTEFGGFTANSYLAYAVRGFFENGGSKAYVARTVKHTIVGEVYTKTSATATKTHPSVTPTITFSALSDGEWGNYIQFEIVAGSVGTKVTLKVYYKNALVETFRDVDATTIESAVTTSEYIKAVVTTATLPAVVAKTSLTTGADGIVGITDADYLYTLKSMNAAKVNLIAIPGVTTSAVQKGLIAHAEARKDAFALLEAPLGSSITDAVTYVNTTATLASEFGAIFYPYVRVSDPIGLGKTPSKLVSPVGHIAGVMARLDATVGVWRAPAGVDAKMQGVIGLEYNVSNAEQDILNPANINAIRSFDGEGICVWGTRTLSSGDYKYIPTRRLIMFIEQSLNENMLWSVFKPNDARLWGMLQSSVTDFLAGIFAQGGIKDYFVKCDAELNTANVVEAGQTYVDLGVAPFKPSEFIIFRISLNR